MPDHTPQSLFTVFGWVIWGDFGPTTIYRTRKGKMVLYAKTYPNEPASAAQITQRQRFTDAAAAWQALTAEQRQQWDLATRRASLCLNGYGLFVHWQTSNDDRAIATLERQTDTTLLP